MVSSDLIEAQDLLHGTDWAGLEPHPMTGDASSRRYYRLVGPDPAVLMDARHAPHGETTRFAEIARLLSDAGLSAPQIYYHDPARGVMVIEDFGTERIAERIAFDPQQEAPIYTHLVPLLQQLGQIAPVLDVPRFDAGHMAEMIRPVFDWYCTDIPTDRADQIVAEMQDALRDIPMDMFSLRDFHAENLMWLPQRDGLRRFGLLDFQDAMIGPRHYDLVSLLQDARRDIRDETVADVLALYADRTGESLDVLCETCAVIGVQRNLRILGIFARLTQEAGKARYLAYMPRVWKYIVQCLAHPRLDTFAKDVMDFVPAPEAAVLEGIRKRCRTDRAL